MPFDRTAYADVYPFESHWMTTAAGHRLHFVDEGPRQAPALLFVHGNPTWSFHWRRFVSHLSSDFRCIAVDHIGCGLSDKPPQGLRLADHAQNLRELTKQLGLARYTLVAQDWGGAIGLSAALAEPERLARIVLFNTGAFPPPYVPWRIAACRWPVVGELAVRGLNAFARAASTMTLARLKRLDPRVTQAYLAPYDSWANRRQIYAFVDDIPTGPQHPTWQPLVELERGLPSLADRPALLVWGMRDWCFRPDCLTRFEQAWPRAEVHRLDDVGHWVVEDAADEALSLVVDFLHRTTSEKAR